MIARANLYGLFNLFSMRTLRLDIETFSTYDLKTVGVYKYVECPFFQIMILAYQWDNGPVQCVDLTAGDPIPPDVLAALTDPNVLKIAYNANFERVCFARHLGIPMPPEQWQCTLVKAGMLGLPMNLEACGAALRLPVQKDKAGHALIHLFCVPQKGKGPNAGKRIWPHQEPEKWKAFIRYCIRDVAAEHAIDKAVDRIDAAAGGAIDQREFALWAKDQHINDRGVLIDQPFIRQAIRLSEEYKHRMTTEAVALTGLTNPNSVKQLVKWLNEEMPEDDPEDEIKTLRKNDIPKILKKVSDDKVRRVLELRVELSKSSVKKYKRMLLAVCEDGYLKGLVQFYGANRTGRWAGRGTQIHNLPRIEMKAHELEQAKAIVRSGDLETLMCFFDSPASVFSQLIRTAFIAPAGSQLVVCDLSAIEARMAAWLAGEAWRMEVFNTHGKIYEASASKMFKVPFEDIDKDSPYRQRGKVSELSLGYQGGVNALIRMQEPFPEHMRVPEDELGNLVVMWRKENPNIVNMWQALNRACIYAVTNQGCIVDRIDIYDKQNQRITIDLRRVGVFYCAGGLLTIQLPSGRKLCYVNPRIHTNQFGKPSVCYNGLNQTSKKWQVQSLYGGKIFENITQAAARDVLAETIAKTYRRTVLHVHDENVLETDKPAETLAALEKAMEQPISWAPGLPLKADGFISPFYRK